MNKILWNSIKSPLQYFWVPAGEDVFAGDYKIENGDGDEAAVDLESIIPFEIDGEEAEAIMMKDLEDMTAELGGLFKGLFSLGKRMINSELMDEDSEDWDSDEDDSDEDDSEFDSDEDSDFDSDEEFDEADLDKVISLFDFDSDEDSDFDSEDDSGEGTLEDLLAQFGDELEGPLSELKDLIAKEVGTLGAELDKLGSEAAANLDTEPGAGQDILRELGQWLINLADERAAEAEEEVVVMEFKPKDGDNAETNNAADSTETVVLDGSSESEAVEEDSESESEDSESVSADTAVDTAVDVVDTVDNDVETAVDDSNNAAIEEDALPSSSSLKRMTKSQLVDLGSRFGMTLDPKDTKNALLEQLETLR